MDLPPGATTRTRAFVYDGRVGELYSIFLLNLLFTILTLGIFRFWAITRYRRYFWSRTRFQGERFEYTGTGGQLFVGFLLAGLVLIGAAAVAFGLGAALAIVWPPLAAVPVVLFYLAILVLGAGAVFSAQRYRLTRTQWCGIRGGMTGSMIKYGLRAVLYGALALLTLFQMVPWVQVRLTERRINASSFGSAQFSFHGRAAKLYGAYVLTLLATIVLFAAIAGACYAFVQTMFPGLIDPNSDLDVAARVAMAQTAGFIVIIGFILLSILSTVVSCWYTALFERHVVGNTALGPMRLASSMRGGALFGLVLGNLLIALVTLGFGYPILLHRNMRFLASTLWVEGAIDPAALTQSTLASPAFGEGMYQQLDATGWM